MNIIVDRKIFIHEIYKDGINTFCSAVFSIAQLEDIGYLIIHITFKLVTIIVRI
jgi:hypothetical protein